MLGSGTYVVLRFWVSGGTEVCGSAGVCVTDVTLLTEVEIEAGSEVVPLDFLDFFF